MIVCPKCEQRMDVMTHEVGLVWVCVPCSTVARLDSVRIEREDGGPVLETYGCDDRSSEDE